tara:strand:+ start:3938 stop:4366 length:429 start_codon:yes stop_codon:yes gene_type:complete
MPVDGNNVIPSIKPDGNLPNLFPTRQEEMAEELDPNIFRSDGSKKSARGFLGPVQHSNGRTMTEVSVGVPINGEEMEIPLFVPGMPQEELDMLSNMEIEGNAKNFPRTSMLRAIEHAMRRLEEGKSPFYQDGEENNPMTKEK